MGRSSVYWQACVDTQSTQWQIDTRKAPRDPHRREEHTMHMCLEPTNCPDDSTGMPCNNCWAGMEADRVQVQVAELDLAWSNLT